MDANIGSALLKVLASLIDAQNALSLKLVAAERVLYRQNPSLANEYLLEITDVSKIVNPPSSDVVLADLRTKIGLVN